MISRRQFCAMVGVGAITMGTTRPSHANASIKVFGIGGAGCNIVDKLRTQRYLPRGISTFTVNRADEPRLCNLKLGSGINCSLSDSDSGKITSLVHSADCVVLVAGLGGQTGTKLVRHLALASKAAYAEVVAVLGLPFAWEGGRVPLALECASELEWLADQVTRIDLEALRESVPSDISVADFFSYADAKMVKVITNVCANAGNAGRGEWT